MDDWQTIDKKKLNKKVGSVHNVVTSGSLLKNSVKIVTKTDFQYYKKIYSEVSFALSELFDSINTMVHTSSQYQSSKQINHNQHNHNKWHTKAIEDCDIDVQINAIFNKISASNVQSVMGTLKDINISVYDEMLKVVDIIYNKCVNNGQLAPLYSKVIKYIMLNYSWVVYDDHCKPISFRKVLVDKMEHDFNFIVDSIRSNEETNEEMKIKRKAFFTMIGAFFNECIFGDQLFRFIFTSLENAFLKTHKNEYMDYWLILSLWANKVWKINNQEYLDEKTAFIRINNKLFNSKIKLLTSNLDDMNLATSDTVIIENSTAKTLTDEPGMFKGYNIANVIDGVSEHGSMDEWFEELTELDEKAPGIIIKIINTLSTKTTDLKCVFSLLLYLKKQKEFTETVLESVAAFSSITSCKAYINNASKLLK